MYLFKCTILASVKWVFNVKTIGVRKVTVVVKIKENKKYVHIRLFVLPFKCIATLTVDNN